MERKVAIVIDGGKAELVWNRDASIHEAIGQGEYHLEQFRPGNWWLWIKEGERNGLSVGTAIMLVSKSPIEARFFDGLDLVQ